MSRLIPGLAIVAACGIAFFWHAESHPVESTPARSTPFKAVAPEPKSRVRQLATTWANADDQRRRALEEQLRDCLRGKDPADIVRELSPDLLDCPLADWAIREWALQDRRAAGDWLGKLNDPTVSHAGYVMYGWLKADPGGLFQYIDGLPEGGWRTNVLKAASNDALAANAGADAVRLLTRLPDAPQRNEMLGWAATAWARSDPVAAAEWAAKSEIAGEQDRLIGAVAIGYAWRDPAGAAAWLCQASAGELPAQAENVAAIWARQDPRSAAGWLATNAAAQRPEIVRQVISNWAYQNLADAETWIGGLSDGALKTESAAALAEAKSRLSGRETATHMVATTLSAPHN